MIEVVPDTVWACPLLGRDIAEGHCLDINLQRLGYFKPDVLAEACWETVRTVDAVSVICECCPNQPLSPDAPVTPPGLPSDG